MVKIVGSCNARCWIDALKRRASASVDKTLWMVATFGVSPSQYWARKASHSATSGMGVGWVAVDVVVLVVELLLVDDLPFVVAALGLGGIALRGVWLTMWRVMMRKEWVVFFAGCLVVGDDV